jgi:PKD repeat protein
VQFTSNCTGIISEYKWTFGDGAESNEEHPKHTYKKKGTYDVSLTVTRAGGATATETKENYITVKGFCPLARSLNNEQDIETLQKVRDRMLPSITGMVLVSMYYRNAFEMVQMLEENPLLQERLREVVANNIGVAEQLIAGELAVVSADQTAEVVRFLETIKVKGSSRLKNDIDMIIMGLEDGHLLQGLGIQVE